MTDPTTTVMLYVSTQVNAASQWMGLSEDDIRLLAIAFGAMFLCVTLLRAFPTRSKSRKKVMTSSERGHLRSVRHERMPE